jgi:hypothetical protein
MEGGNKNNKQRKDEKLGLRKHNGAQLRQAYKAKEKRLTQGLATVSN